MLIRPIAIVLIALVFGGLATAKAVPRVEGGELGIPDAHWPEIYFRTFDGVTVSAGLEPLRAKVLPDETREMRVWIGGGSGYPQSLYRIVERQGDVAGELILYWPTDSKTFNKPGDTFHELMLFHHSSSCDAFSVAADMGTCRALFGQQPNWAETLQRAERAGLWQLPDSSELPDDGIITMGGWGLTVELHDGVAYRTYQYNNPEAHMSWPEAARAIEIVEAFRDVGSLVQQTDVDQTYRGVTTGEYGSALHLCNSDEVWGVRFSFEALVKEAGLILPDSGSYGYLVEVIGKPTPEWLAREWRSVFSQDLQAREVVSVTPAHTAACE